MRKHLIFTVIILLTIICLPKATYAVETAEVDVNIDKLCNIWFHPDEDNIVVFDEVLKSDYDIGYTAYDEDDEDMKICWYANFTWWIYVAGDPAHPYFICDGTGWDEKPFSDIWLVDGGDDYEPLTASPILLKNGSSGTYPTEGFSEVLTFRVKLSWDDDTPDTYNYNWVTFTISDVEL